MILSPIHHYQLDKALGFNEDDSPLPIHSLETIGATKSLKVERGSQVYTEIEEKQMKLTTISLFLREMM